MAHRLKVFTKRVWREFFRFVTGQSNMLFRSPVVWRNVRATWIQSNPNWFQKMQDEQEPISDEEAEELARALKEMREGT